MRAVSGRDGENANMPGGAQTLVIPFVFYPYVGIIYGKGYFGTSPLYFISSGNVDISLYKKHQYIAFTTLVF